MSKIPKEVIFDTMEEALKYVKEFGISTQSVEGPALSEIANQGAGINVFKETDSIRKMVSELRAGGDGVSPPLDQPPPFEGIPPSGERPAIGGSIAIGRYLAPRKRTFERIELQTKIPAFSQLYQPVEDGMLQKR